MFNLNETIDRRHTNCVKWNAVETSCHEKDLLPLRVADMDFKVHQPILDVLSQVIEQGALGYAVASNELYQAIQDWQQQHHQLIVEKEEILFNSSVVPSLATAVQAYTAPADSIMTCDPVYPPFADVVRQNERRFARHSLLEVNGHYEVDLVKMEQQIIEEKVRLLFSCNPHNPGGRVWIKEELLAIGRLRKKHQVTVASDEIHQDLIFKPHTFTSSTVADGVFKEFTVILTAATKTSNLAGIKNSMLLIPNEKLRQSFVSLQDKDHQGGINIFGYVGTVIAYQTGEEWLAALLDYLKENTDFALSFSREEMPDVRVMEPEGAYLLWLDSSSHSLTDQELRDTLAHEGKVVLNPGISFGSQGSQHMCLNLACSRKTLEEGLSRIKKAFN